MRQLIDTEFKDVTSYPDLASGDIGGIVIDHFTGPANVLTRMTFDQFIQAYPPTRGVALTPSYVNAYRAFQTGLGQVEVVRLQGESKYAVATSPAGKPALTLAREDKPSLGENAVMISLRNPGNPAELYDDTAKYLILIEVATENTEIGVTELTISYVKRTTEGENTTDEIIESVTGALQEGAQIEGENYDIGQLLQSMANLTGEVNYSANLTAGESEVLLTKEIIADDKKITSEDLANSYMKYFKSIESSEATIMIDPGTTNQSEASAIIGISSYRQDCVSLIGYPVSSKFDKETITTYFQTLKIDMFSAGYAIREQVTIAGKKYSSNGIGALAGTYAAVANAESVNQLPSAKTWGSFSAVLLESLEFDDVLELHKQGINSCYNSVDGPRLFGLRSLYKRATSYYSKFNVARVCARILQYAFSVAMDAIHTGNTDARKALTQNLLDSDLKRLVAQGALRVESSVVCDGTNNKDLDTQGGEILIIDYTCYFVKLIERVKIRITATDSSVSASLS